MRIEVTQLTKSFGNHRALEIASFACEFERCLALIGPSGGGKSTLLRLLGGLEIAEHGEIKIDGTPLPKTETSLRAYRREIGFVFQGFNLFPHLTALQNVTLPLTEVHGLSSHDAQTRACQNLERFGLASHAHKTPGQLSGGQRQRVAIARAAACQPRFLLLDEPTSALDPEMTVEVLELLEELREQGVTLILVTHEIGFARHAADRVAFVANGDVTFCDSAEAFFQDCANDSVRAFLSKTLKFV